MWIYCTSFKSSARYEILARTWDVEKIKEMFYRRSYLQSYQRRIEILRLQKNIAP